MDGVQPVHLPARDVVHGPVTVQRRGDLVGTVQRDEHQVTGFGVLAVDPSCFMDVGHGPEQRIPRPRCPDTELLHHTVLEHRSDRVTRLLGIVPDDEELADLGHLGDDTCHVVVSLDKDDGMTKEGQGIGNVIVLHGVPLLQGVGWMERRRLSDLLRRRNLDQWSRSTRGSPRGYKRPQQDMRTGPRLGSPDARRSVSSGW
ncbi:hypothetical protein D3C73_1185850 [compost metagenome]